MRLRFSIRDLLWLVVAISLGFSWMVDHRRVEEDRLRAKEFYFETLQAEKDRVRQLISALGNAEAELMRAKDGEQRARLGGN